MNNGWFDVPVRIETGGSVKIVMSAREAADILSIHWLEERGPKYDIARRACLSAMQQHIAPMVARRAFENAAREAGILVES